MPPKKKTVVPQMTLNLRPGRDSMPGAPDQPKPRRTSAEVAAANALKEKEKQRLSDRRTAAILGVSRKENEMNDQDMLIDSTADHPPVSAKIKASRLVAQNAAAKRVAEIKATALDLAAMEGTSCTDFSEALSKCHVNLLISDTDEDLEELVTFPVAASKAAEAWTVTKQGTVGDSEPNDADAERERKRVEKKAKKTGFRAEVNAQHALTYLDDNQLSTQKRKIIDGDVDG
jgi:uncharacterized protein (DUF779 family)